MQKEKKENMGYAVLRNIYNVSLVLCSNRLTLASEVCKDFTYWLYIRKFRE
jgi:hypothetical protein